MNSFGTIFRITIWGESHGAGVGVIVDGVPPGIKLKKEDFTEDLLRRKSGGLGTTPRIESDEPFIKSGIFQDSTTGAPILICFENSNTKSKDYEKTRFLFRPGHADFTAWKKYQGFDDYRGGGRFSGRLTLGLVAAGVIAKKIIQPIKIFSKITEVGGRADWAELLKETIEKKDSLGAICQCEIQNVPAGLGEPFFDSVESLISHGIFSIPGVRGIEFGSGFHSAEEKGSSHNDSFVNENGETATNHAGGINGGISNGNTIVFKTAFKPTASIGLRQKTFDFYHKKMDNLQIEGRHDVCFALRVPVIVESIAAVVLADLIMRNKKSEHI